MILCCPIGNGNYFSFWGCLELYNKAEKFTAIEFEKTIESFIIPIHSFQMVKKRVDPRVKGLIENGVRKNHRSMFVLVGDHGKDQVENLHKILSSTRVKARPSVLWCYKKELGFSTHRQKRMKEIKRNQARGLHDPDRDDPFDLFISSTNIRWTYYKETDKILGQTFGMCVLQDFEVWGS